MNSEELLQSNLTKMLKYIILKMEEHDLHQNSIKKVENISQELKNRIMKYLNDTIYYDQFLKIMEKNKQIKADIESQIVKIVKKQSHNKVKK